MNTNNEVLFDHKTNVAPLSLIAMSGATELGNKINDYLVKWAHKGGFQTDSFLIESECPRFSSGDGKGLIKQTVRGKDLFIITDMGNYSITYDYFGKTNAMSPDDHFQDLKRIIQAASGKAHRINVTCRSSTAADSIAATTASPSTAPLHSRSSRRWALRISSPLTRMTRASAMQCR